MGNSLRPGRLLRGALRGRAGRAWLAGSGVAASSLLALALLAAHRGATTGVAAYSGQDGFDVWVAPRGVDNLVRSAGQLPVGGEEAIRTIPGVADVGPILRTFAAVEAGPDGDLERAVVRRMIALIREHYSGNFQWESYRLDRVLVLSAAPEDNEGLEEFLLREFFQRRP